MDAAQFRKTENMLIKKISKRKQSGPIEWLKYSTTRVTATRWTYESPMYFLRNDHHARVDEWSVENEDKA